MTQLKSSEFKTAQAYPCGYENRDAENGYQKEVPVQETPIAKMINNAEVLPRNVGNER